MMYRVFVLIRAKSSRAGQAFGEACHEQNRRQDAAADYFSCG